MPLWRLKKLGSKGVAVSFVGDGGANQGTTLESLNLASIWDLPCIFVVENNGYAEATSCKYAGACHDFADRANGFNMPGVTVDGHDFFAVHEVAARGHPASARGRWPHPDRVQGQPLLRSLRRRCQTYRAPDEVKKIRETRDCITRFAQTVTSAGLLESAELETIDREVMHPDRRFGCQSKSCSEAGRPTF